MRDLTGAMNEEKAYVDDRMRGIDTVLIDRLTPYGYGDLTEYFEAKREYLFNQWQPEVYPAPVCTLTADLEAAIREKRYGIYISTHDGLYAFHGSDEIDYALCEELGICVAELYYNGGTIVGSNQDLGIWICAPEEISLTGLRIIRKFFEIISKYIPGTEISGNDILVNGEKVMGSMERHVDDVFVWAAQISFGDYTDIIAQICNKKSVKTPGHIDTTLLTRDQLESEVVTWLQKR